MLPETDASRLDVHSGEQARIAILEVNAANVAAVLLYQQLGFQHVATRKRYYSNTDDAWVMHRLM